MNIRVPSYVIPGTYAENIRFLNDKRDIHGVELLFFYYDAETQELLDAELPVIQEHTKRFQYSLHLPDKLGPEHQHLIELTADFTAYYVVHPPEHLTTQFLEMLTAFQTQWGKRFYVENLIGRGAAFQELAEHFPICMDYGHLLVNKQDVSSFLAWYAEKIKAIHLHGLKGEKDHHAILGTEPDLNSVLDLALSNSLPVNLEMFSFEHVKESLQNIGVV